ncbi:MAG: hypothetical protein ACYDH9_16060 [Limisphaerales bacterium]
MEKTGHKGWMWGRCVLAAFIAVLFLAIVLPNTGRIVFDQTTTPSTLHIVGRVRQSLIMIGIAAVPVALILVGTFRRSRLEIPGWILLAVLIGMLLMK